MKIEKLEAIRGFAAVYVVIHHFIGFTILKNKLPFLIRLPFRFGQEAVILFFLLSGFVIYVSVAKSNNMTFAQYFKRRAVRIYPIAIVAFLISILILFLNGNHLKNYDYRSLVGNLLMLKDTDESKPGNIVTPFLDNFPLWSLSYEWWFYMLFYPIFYLKSKRNILKINSSYLVLFISIIGWLAFIFIPNHIFLVLAYFSIWWAGVACGEVYLTNKDFAFKSLVPVLISLFVMASLMFIPVIKTYLNHGRLSQILYPVLTFRHYLFAFSIIIIGWGWWKLKLLKFDMLLG